MRLYDAHNHLQDERFAGRQTELVAVCRAEGVAGMVVNGACESDWPEVASLAKRFPDLVRPSFGYHPWYIHERTSEWQATLLRFLDAVPGAVVGEIGLDRWKPDLAYEGQEEVFTWQLRVAAERGLPASIHCLQAWGRLFELLRCGPRPPCGFLLHSYGGPIEMVAPLAKLGAYFSLPGYYAHERKHRQRAAFLAVPRDRLLIETDAPDQRLPAAPGKVDLLPPAAPDLGWERYPLTSASRVLETRNSMRSSQVFSPLPSGLQGLYGARRAGTGKRKEGSRAGEEVVHGSEARPASGCAINHPANLGAVYEFAARLLEEGVADLATRVEANFHRLFGLRPAGGPAHPPAA